MNPTLPVLLFAMAAPPSQITDLNGFLNLVPVEEPRPSLGGGLMGHVLAPSEIRPWVMQEITVISELRPALRQIEDYRKLPEGWDAGEARVAASWSVDAASSFVSGLAADLPDPTPMIASSGEVSLYWMNGETYVEIGFDEQGTCFLFAEAPSMESIHLDDCLPDDERVIMALRSALATQEHHLLAA